MFCPPIRGFDDRTSGFARPLESVLAALYKNLKVLAALYKNLKGGLALHFYERKSKEQSIFDHV